MLTDRLHLCSFSSGMKIGRWCNGNMVDSKSIAQGSTPWRPATNTMKHIRYFWVKFYPGAEWQIVKFWHDQGTRYIKGIDWAIPHELEKFDNKDYRLGEEITIPSN